jgi:hypothetical protein
VSLGMGPSPVHHLLLQGPLSGPHGNSSYPRGHLDAFRVGGPLEQLPFVVRASKLVLWKLASRWASRPAFLRGFGLHARMLSG